MLCHIFDKSVLNIIIVSKYQLKTVFLEALKKEGKISTQDMIQLKSLFNSKSLAVDRKFE